jgi:hypothetical protein
MAITSKLHQLPPPRRRRSRAAALIAALVGLLLMGTGIAQAAQGAAGTSASAHHRVSKVYLTVTPEEPKTIPGGRKPLPRTSPHGRTGIHPDAGVLTPLQYITPDECLAQPSSSRGNGWAKGRFDSCQSYHLHTWHVVCDWWFCDQVGTADADLVDYQYTDNGDRQITVSQFIGNWTSEGDMSEVDLTVNTTCDPTLGSGPCDTVFGAPTMEPVESWLLLGDQVQYYVFNQPTAAGLGTDRVSYANLSWHLTADGGENGPVTRNGPASQVRCDSASYLLYAGAGNGCIFPWAPTPTWTIHRSTTPQSAQNIYEAQTTPLATQPPSSILGIPFKDIAGAPGVAPLHRDANRDDINNHRNTARAACRTYFPGTYPGPNTDCDEYPFASTLEGSVNYGNFRNYVVKPIDSKDNQDAGHELGDFYAAQRILGDDGINDPFYVSVQP